MEKLRIKDLVTIGVFTVIYFVLMFASGMIGIVPILYLAYPTLAGDWAKSLENRRKHYKILKQDFIVLFSLIN